MGFYPTKTEIEGALKQLRVELPLNLPHFLELANFMENINCESGLHARDIFDACDVSGSGKLDNVSEIRFALQALGFYPKVIEIESAVKHLCLEFPLELHQFLEVANFMEKGNCERGLRALPYARRGLTLRQLKKINMGLKEDGWLQGQCDKFNQDHAHEIGQGKKYEFPMQPNLYALDKEFVKPTTKKKPATSSDANARSEIKDSVLQAAGIPASPAKECCFAQLLNPDGLEVDYFVSHWWGHPFERTVQALDNFAKFVYKKIGKKSPDDVVFWVCLFAVNQHQAKEEVGSTPEEGPFNAGLAHARHGAVMVLDERAMPLERIWCLYEVRPILFGRSQNSF